MLPGTLRGYWSGRLERDTVRAVLGGRAAVLLLALVLAGCASGDGPEATPTESRHAAPQPTEPPAAAASPPRLHPRAQDSRPPEIRRLAERYAHRSERLEQAARELIALDPTVLCWNKRGWRKTIEAANRGLPPDEQGDFDGLADLYAATIHLAPWVCKAIESLPERPSDELVLADAIHVFAHETRHLTSAGSNEAAAECAALQVTDDAAVALGLDEATGRRLARLSWEEVYPVLLPEYRSTECRPGGALDREPQTPDFP